MEDKDFVDAFVDYVDFLVFLGGEDKKVNNVKMSENSLVQRLVLKENN